MRAGRLARTPGGRLAGGVVLLGTLVVVLALMAGLLTLVVQSIVDVAMLNVDWAVVGRAALGSVLLALGAGVIAGPIGAGMALWSRWLAPHLLRPVLSWGIQVLGDVPPVVFAVLVLAALGDLDRWVVTGLALTFVAVPAVARRCLEVLEEVQDEDLLRGVALGATPAQAVTHVALPRVGRSLVLGSFTGVARALGDTVIALILLESHRGTLTAELATGFRDGALLGSGTLFLLALLATTLSVLAWVMAGRSR